MWVRSRRPRFSRQPVGLDSQAGGGGVAFCDSHQEKPFPKGSDIISTERSTLDQHLIGGMRVVVRRLAQNIPKRAKMSRGWYAVCYQKTSNPACTRRRLFRAMFMHSLN